AYRMNLVVRFIMPWRLPAWPALTSPEAVTLKRFFALDLVFILGLSVSFLGSRERATRHATSGRPRGTTGEAITGAGEGMHGDRRLGLAVKPSGPRRDAGPA